MERKESNLKIILLFQKTDESGNPLITLEKIYYGDGEGEFDYWMTTEFFGSDKVEEKLNLDYWCGDRGIGWDKCNDKEAIGYVKAILDFEEKRLESLKKPKQKQKDNK